MFLAAEARFWPGMQLTFPTAFARPSEPTTKLLSSGGLSISPSPIASAILKAWWPGSRRKRRWTLYRSRRPELRREPPERLQFSEHARGVRVYGCRPDLPATHQR